MSHFANMVEDAYYEDATYSTVNIVYKDHDKVTRSHSVPADMENADFAFLVNEEGYNENLLIKRTEVYKKSMSRNVNSLINHAAQELADEMVEEKLRVKIDELNDRLIAVGNDNLAAKLKKDKAESLLIEAENAARIAIDTKTFSSIAESNEDKDEIFKFKLWAMERDEIKSCTNEEKKSIRKETTLFGCIAKYHELTNK